MVGDGCCLSSLIPRFCFVFSACVNATAIVAVARTQVWGETWMYSPENYGKTVRTLAAMAEYINHIEDSFDLDNVMALELLNEPWAHLVREPR